MKYAKKKLFMATSGIVLGLAIFAVSIGTALMVAQLAFGLDLVAMLGMGAVAGLLSPLGMGIALAAVGVLAMASSSLLIHFYRQFTPPPANLTREMAEGQQAKHALQAMRGFGEEYSPLKKKSYSFGTDVILGVTGSLLAASGVTALMTLSALGILSVAPVILITALAGASAFVLLPFVKLALEKCLSAETAEDAVKAGKINRTPTPSPSGDFTAASIASYQPYGYSLSPQKTETDSGWKWPRISFLGLFAGNQTKEVQASHSHTSTPASLRPVSSRLSRSPSPRMRLTL